MQANGGQAQLDGASAGESDSGPNIQMFDSAMDGELTGDYVVDLVDGHLAGGFVTNGDCHDGDTMVVSNGTSETIPPMSDTDQDIVRLISQHLRNLGLQ